MKISVVFVATAVAGAMVIEARPVPVTALIQKRSLDVPIAMANTQLYQRKEAQLEKRMDVAENVMKAAEKSLDTELPKITEVAAPDGAASSHVDPSASSSSEPLRAVDPEEQARAAAERERMRQELQLQDESWQKHFDRFAKELGVVPIQRRPHQVNMHERDVCREEWDRSHKTEKLAFDHYMDLWRGANDAGDLLRKAETKLEGNKSRWFPFLHSRRLKKEHGIALHNVEAISQQAADAREAHGRAWDQRERTIIGDYKYQEASDKADKLVRAEANARQAKLPQSKR